MQSLEKAELFEYSKVTVDSVLSSFSSKKNGLTSEFRELYLEKFGLNKIESKRKETVWTRLFDATVNPFTLILLVIIGISFFTDVVVAAEPDWTTILIIFAMLILSSAISFVQAQKSSSAAESLRKMISNKVDILIDGRKFIVDLDQIVPGDIVQLSAGDMLPADVRFIKTKDLFLAQAVLTGESEPVEKFFESRLNLNDASEVSETELDTIGYMGSNVISGSASAVVLRTGNSTLLGQISQSIEKKADKNAFERGVDSVSKLLIRFMVVMVPIVFIINALTKGNAFDALLFAIAIAVGLTPEMLPVIITSTLSLGAINLSKRKVIVKDLSAIQGFGEMSILCTDKTGTLTEDKIILEKYMNVHGVDDDRILRHAYLNSTFQTGLKNLLDLAIINRAKENGLSNTLTKYKRIDEIPFDFTRRRMSVILEDDKGKRQLITKGAVEEILAVSSYIEIDGEVQKIDSKTRALALKTYEKHNSDGLRMIAVAQKNGVPKAGEFSVKDESDLILIGFVGFLDPPKESAKLAIDELKEHGVRTVVLTGDSEGVAKKVCEKVGISSKNCLTGTDVSKMTDSELQIAVHKTNLFSKLSPQDKERVVKAFQKDGLTVGFMGDGINDAPALNIADVGISVDTAVDIAKETAAIILLEKDLRVLSQGVISGRTTFGNIMKYLKLAVSGNFGNMFSVIIASIVLPFLPMLPSQILAQNLLTDLSQAGMPFDKVDESFLAKPRKWEVKSIKRFMFVMGPISSIFDILCFAAMWFIIGATANHAPLFQAGWFVFGTLSQILVIYICRTEKLPFIQSLPSKQLFISTIIVGVIVIIIGFSSVANAIDMQTLPTSYSFVLVALLLLYFIAAQIAKIIYIRFNKSWI